MKGSNGSEDWNMVDLELGSIASGADTSIASCTFGGRSRRYAKPYHDHFVSQCYLSCISLSHEHPRADTQMSVLQFHVI